MLSRRADSAQVLEQIKGPPSTLQGAAAHNVDGVSWTAIDKSTGPALPLRRPQCGRQLRRRSGRV